MDEKEYRFRIKSTDKTLYFQGHIIQEDDEFLSITDRKVGFVRLAKKFLISQEEVVR